MFKSVNSHPMVFLNHLCFIYGILANSNNSFLFYQSPSRILNNIYIIVISFFKVQDSPAV